VKDNEEKSCLDASHKDVLVKVGEVEDASRGVVCAPMDDLEVLPIVDDEGHGEITLMKMKILWSLKEDNDYPAINIKDFFG